ncbi:MAG TPA: PRC-barrel domain-containing protein [Vicinamibacterales bacterium]
MLRRTSSLERLTPLARDGEIGHVEDFLFDEQAWTVRYLVVRTGRWLGRRVLISPMAVAGDPDWINSRLPLNLTREQIAGSPPIDEGPITRALEAETAAYYGFPPYWDGPELWGWAGRPDPLAPMPPPAPPPPPETATPPAGEPEIRTALVSANETRGYHIQARDGSIGHVDDFLLDDGPWTVRYLQLDTSNWLGGRRVLITPDWIERLDRTTHLIHVDLERAEIENSPEWDGNLPLDRAFEARLFRHYRKRGYWEDGSDEP